MSDWTLDEAAEWAARRALQDAFENNIDILTVRYFERGTDEWVAAGRWQVSLMMSSQWGLPWEQRLRSRLLAFGSDYDPAIDYWREHLRMEAVPL